MRALSDYIRTFDDALPAEFCEQLVAEFHRHEAHHARNGAGIRPGLEESAWNELDFGASTDVRMRALFLDQIQAYHQKYNQELGLSLPVSPVRRLDQLILKRYRAGADEQFQLHFDSLGPVANRYLVFLWYLNDVSEGGQTEFPDLGVKIAPRTGRLLMFPPYWMFQHAGRPPLSGDKYILSTYLLY